MLDCLWVPLRGLAVELGLCAAVLAAGFIDRQYAPKYKGVVKQLELCPVATWAF